MTIPVRLKMIAQQTRHGDDAGARALIARVMEEAGSYFEDPAPDGLVWTITSEGVLLRPWTDRGVRELREEAEAVRAAGGEPVVLFLGCDCGRMHPSLGMKIDLGTQGHLMPSPGGASC